MKSYPKKAPRELTKMPRKVSKKPKKKNPRVKSSVSSEFGETGY